MAEFTSANPWLKKPWTDFFNILLEATNHPMKTAFVYSAKFGSVIYGMGHPMRPARLKLAYELMESLGLFNLPDAGLVEARRATEDEIRLFHAREYINTLKEANTGVIPVSGREHGIGFGDNPVFKGVYEWSSYTAGASIQAAELVALGASRAAFNIGGGLHHAMPARASGFCYINDPAVAVKYLAGLGKRVAYVDIDAHHGDGVEYAFYDTDAVLTISLHESGQYLFPGTGNVTDIGIKGGTGYSVNLPLPPGTGDGLFMEAFNEVVPLFMEAFDPDILVTQLGVDTFESDPLSHMNLTTNGFEKAVCAFRDMNLPWVALGGGGYDLGNVARAWTLAWAAMNRADVPDKIPRELMEGNEDIFRTDSMRDAPPARFPLGKEHMEELERDIAYLKTEVLPLTKRRAGRKAF